MKSKKNKELVWQKGCWERLNTMKVSVLLCAIQDISTVSFHSAVTEARNGIWGAADV